jgi:hypothetical protein
MYAQKAVVGGITATWYWSSSESGKDTAWTQRFTDGLQMDDSSKWGDNYVRAVRAF